MRSATWLRPFFEPTDQGDWPCLWIEATYLTVRRAGWIISVAVIIAIYERTSMLITTKMSFTDWASVIGDAKVTTALLDRLIEPQFEPERRSATWREVSHEGLFEQPSEELTRYVEIEEQHFLPMLRKHSETKHLAADALKGNKELRASLKKLTEMPKDTDEFLAELDILKKSFQQHVRNERKELLPAVLKALSDEEAGTLADNIDEAVSEAEKAKRDEKREENAQAKREAEEAEQAKADERAAVRAQKAAERSAREVTEKAAETVARGAASVQDAARQVTAKIKDETQKVASDTREAMSVYSETTQKIRDDVQARGETRSLSASVARCMAPLGTESLSTSRFGIGLHVSQARERLVLRRERLALVASTPLACTQRSRRTSRWASELTPAALRLASEARPPPFTNRNLRMAPTLHL